MASGLGGRGRTARLRGPAARRPSPRLSCRSFPSLSLPSPSPSLPSLPCLSPPPCLFLPPSFRPSPCLPFSLSTSRPTNLTHSLTPGRRDGGMFGGREGGREGGRGDGSAGATERRRGRCVGVPLWGGGGRGSTVGMKAETERFDRQCLLWVTRRIAAILSDGQ